MERRGLKGGIILFIQVVFLAFIFLNIAIMLISTAYAQSDSLTVKFHSKGDGKNVTVDLTKYLPPAAEYMHTEVQNVTVIMNGHMATIIAKPGWVGNELITFSSNSTLIEEIGGGKAIGGEETINLEPIIEMSFPQSKDFAVSPGQIQFTVIAYDPDNDMLVVDWLVNGVPAKQEKNRGGVISHFIFNETAAENFGGILRGTMFSEEDTHYSVTALINDSKNEKILEWHFNILNQTCNDIWNCNDWSECIGGKRYRICSKVNEECEATGNKPPSEWIDPVCISPLSGCSPAWKCGNWSDCRINYNFRLVTGGLIASAVRTKQERLCYDINYCTRTAGIETRECEQSIPITTREVIWCNQEYIEIFNTDTGQFLSRIKRYRIGGEFGLDIDLSLKGLKLEDYCWYCFNGIKDYDEFGTDCGGSCPECTEFFLQQDLGKILRFTLFLLADLLLVVYAFIWIRRR